MSTELCILYVIFCFIFSRNFQFRSQNANFILYYIIFCIYFRGSRYSNSGQTHNRAPFQAIHWVYTGNRISRYLLYSTRWSFQSHLFWGTHLRLWYRIFSFICVGKCVRRNINVIVLVLIYWACWPRLGKHKCVKLLPRTVSWKRIVIIVTPIIFSPTRTQTSFFLNNKL